MDWKIAHDAFVAYADEVLPDAPPPVRVLGIDETRRGKGRYEVVTSTGVKVWVDRFDTGLVDLDGTGGLFAQVNGRTSAAVIAWLEAQDPAWRAAITHVSMDTSATYARAARHRAAARDGRGRSVPPGAAGEPGAHRVPAGTDLGDPRPSAAAKLIWGSFLSRGQAEVPPFGSTGGCFHVGPAGGTPGERHVSTRGQADMRGLVTA